MNVRDFLSQNNVQYEVIRHQPTYDAQRMAESVHVSGRDVAKTVLLRSDGTEPYYVAVLPANKTIDFEKAHDAVGGKIELATEIEIKQRCPDCEIGALPPFGSQYGMPTVVDESLTGEEEIVFEGNTHDEAVRIKYADFQQLENPRVIQFAHRPA